MAIINLSKNQKLKIRILSASTFKARLKGLLGSSDLDENCALLINHCSGIHTIGMKYTIDVVFLDKHNMSLIPESIG